MWSSERESERYDALRRKTAASGDERVKVLFLTHRASLAHVVGRCRALFFRSSLSLDSFQKVRWASPLTEGVGREFSRLPCVLGLLSGPLSRS